MSSLDWTIIAIYMMAVVGLGVAAGFRRRKGEPGGEGRRYFLAGDTLAWPVIGLAMFAANISTVHVYWPQADAIADACAFLTSDKARFISGPTHERQPRSGAWLSPVPLSL